MTKSSEHDKELVQAWAQGQRSVMVGTDLSKLANIIAAAREEGRREERERCAAIVDRWITFYPHDHILSEIRDLPLPGGP